MFTFLIRTSLRNRLFVLLAAAALVVYGSLTLRDLPVDVFPDLNRPTVTVLTESHGLAPEEVERLVSFPIEVGMSGLPGVNRIISTTTVGLSIVFIEFDWNSDLYRNRQLVAERLARVREQLPLNVSPQMGPVTSIMGEIMLVAMWSDQHDAMTLRDTADWVLRPRLLAVPGVAQVLPIGGEVRQFRVSPDPRWMALYNIEFRALELAVRAYSENTGGGYIVQNGREFTIRNIGRLPGLEPLRDVVVGYFNGTPVLLRQIAEVDFVPRVKRGDAGFMGKSAVILGVQKQPAVNTLKLTYDVEAVLKEMAAFLPEGMSIENVLYRQANFIEASVENLTTVLWEAAIVVAIILFAFLLNVRTTLISLSAIPLSLLVTVLIFHWMGLTINTMTLGGLAIAVGELVDDAVVDVENIFRRLRQNMSLPNPRPILDVVANASIEVRSGIVYATAIILLVFLPLLALGGVEGRMFIPLAIAYIVSIAASLMISITVTPVMAYFLLPNLSRLKHGDGWLVRKLKGVNERLLHWAFGNGRTIFTGAGCLVVVAAIALAVAPRSFLPPLNEGLLLVEVGLTPGVSLDESSRVGVLAEKILREIPEVKSVGRRTGRAELDTHATGVNNNELDVELLSSGRPRAEVLRDMRERLSVLPATVFIGQPISHRIELILSGVRSQIAIKIFGDDLDTLISLGEGLRERIAGVPGLVDVQVERQTRIPQVSVFVDPARAMLYGLTPAEVTTMLDTMSNGTIVSQVVDERRRVDVFLRLADHDRTTHGLHDFLIPTQAGRIPLSRIATVEETDGPNQIIREDGRRRIAVMANTDGSDMGAILPQIRSAIAAMKVPTGYYASIEGSYQAQQEATTRIALLSLISLGFIFVLLYSRYRSAVLALIVMVNIPLAMVGAITAMWVFGLSLSLATMVGFITLAGISARNGILKISHYINLVLHEGETFGPKMIVRGSLERMSPVLMTALCAGCALIPLMMGFGDPGKEILAPVAAVVLGGLITSTVLDAIMTPILFLRFGEAPLRNLVDRHAEGGVAEAY